MAIENIDRISPFIRAIESSIYEIEFTWKRMDADIPYYVSDSFNELKEAFNGFRQSVVEDEESILPQ